MAGSWMPSGMAGSYPPPPPPPETNGRARRGAGVGSRDSFAAASGVAAVQQGRLVLTREEAQRVLEGMNVDLPVDAIIRLFGVAPGSQMAAAIEEFYTNQKRPPKPHPVDCKILSVKTAGPVLPLYHYKCTEDPMKRYYTLLVIGATGTGKTTLLDAFANCLCDQQYTDHWRWKLVDESRMQAKHGSQSQTEEITYYHITDLRPNRSPCHVKIIDTPGFGDTSGMAADEAIIKKFEHLFKNEVQELDCVLLVVKAGESRWTDSNRYVYDRIQEMFGKDAESRFVLMCTFADGTPPLAVETLKPPRTVSERLPVQQLCPSRPIGQWHSADKVLLEDGHGERGQLPRLRREDIPSTAQSHKVCGGSRPARGGV